MKTIDSLFQVMIEVLSISLWMIGNKWLAYALLYFWSFALLPRADASASSPFPDVTFFEFSEFINNNFGSEISLTTVLTIIFTLTNNPELLNLHARQQLAKIDGENVQLLTGWIKSLARALEERLNKKTDELFHQSEKASLHTNIQVTNTIAIKLDAFSKFLKLNPFDKHGQYQQKLNAVSTREIEAVHIICPDVMECETISCRPRSLLQDTRDRDIPRVTLIKGINIHDHVHLLTGKCPDCETRYYADHESSWQSKEHNTQIKFYLNAAKLVRIYG